MLDHLVVAYGEQIKLLDDIENLKRPKPPDPQQQKLLTGFGGPGPYPALRVDALRDAQRAVRSLMQRLAVADRALDTLKVGQIEERKAAEAVRLAEDRLSRARGQQETDRERDNRDTSLLLQRLAETELVKDKIATESKTLQARDTEMERLLTRVLPEQELGKDELEQQQALLRKELKQLNAEAERLLAENGRRVTERERLVADADAGRDGAQAAQGLHVLDARFESDRIRLLR